MRCRLAHGARHPGHWRERADAEAWVGTVSWPDCRSTARDARRGKREARDLRFYHGPQLWD